MNCKCFHCGAYFWSDEKLSISTKTNLKFGLCCMNGKIVLPLFQKPPDFLCSLLTELTSEARTFRNYIRMYNSSLAFASIGADVDETITGKGVYNFKIQGSMYHRIGPLLPHNGQTPKFAQIYFHDTDHELENRLNLFNGLDKQIMKQLQDMMHQCSPFYQHFKHSLENMNSNQQTELQLIIRADQG